MRILVVTTILLIGSILMLGCATTQISQEQIRKSDRFYDAAYIAWTEKGDNLTAIRHLTRSVEANPNNDDAQYLLGTIRLSRGEYEEAETHLLLSIEHRKNMPAKRVEAQNSLGVVYIHTKRFEEAVVILEDASKEVLNRAPWLAYGNLGWAYTELGKYDEAIGAIKRALFDQPQFCVGLYRMGNAYYLKGEYESAKTSLLEALSIQADGCGRLQEAYHLLGMTNLRLDNLDDAINAFESCVEINPKSEIGSDCTSVVEGL